MAVDPLTREARSAHMRRIRKRDTGPELVVRRLAHSLGYRFRLYSRDLPGSPDLTFPRYRKVVLVHGCFWHQHKGCRLTRQPKSRLDYWLPKFSRNVDRDIEVRQQLSDLGWESLVIWECETKDGQAIAKRLSDFLGRCDDYP